MNAIWALVIVWIAILVFVAFMVAWTGDGRWAWCLLILLFLEAKSTRG